MRCSVCKTYFTKNIHGTVIHNCRSFSVRSGRHQNLIRHCYKRIFVQQKQSCYAVIAIRNKKKTHSQTLSYRFQLKSLFCHNCIEGTKHIKNYLRNIKTSVTKTTIYSSSDEDDIVSMLYCSNTNTLDLYRNNTSYYQIVNTLNTNVVLHIKV